MHTLGSSISNSLNFSSDCINDHVLHTPAHQTYEVLKKEIYTTDLSLERVLITVKTL